MGCVPLNFNFRMKNSKKIASLAPISDPEVKGQPMRFMGTQQEMIKVALVLPPSHSGTVTLQNLTVYTAG